ncbi:hypothetical protein AK812_SmicGene2831 [Symbiodinium microadriaticum]|uniref:Uncharacterized protein n=1 Tax=Symbiodinium microadriaticum TaxID=2951 RepID=A0A1Q9F0K4_SYMMI|nr:hypothetical protein AK812_SmicGene2831 [Symbiodinium microadriaticum]
MSRALASKGLLGTLEGMGGSHRVLVFGRDDMSKFGVDRQSNQGSFFNGTFPASYDSFYFMEIDAVPVRPFWLDQFIAEVQQLRFIPELLSAAVDTEANGSAVYNLQHPWLRWLYEQLELEQSTEFNAIAFDLRMANLSLEGREGTNADAAAAWAQHVPSDEDAYREDSLLVGRNYANTLLNSSFLAQTWKVEDPPRLLALQGSGPEKPRFDAGVYVRHGATSNIFENLNDSLVTLAAVSFDGSSGVYERFNQSLSVYHPFRKVLVISYGQHRVAPAGTVEVVAGDAGDAEVRAEWIETGMCRSLAMISLRGGLQGLDSLSAIFLQSFPLSRELAILLTLQGKLVALSALL